MAVDEAAKIEYAKLLVKSGEAQGLEAGGLASKRLVDYEHTSPFVRNVMRYIAPFGTFRGSIPGAVVGGIARNPARAALLNRMSGGTMYGGQPAPFHQGGQPVDPMHPQGAKQPWQFEMYNPTADVSRGLDFITPWRQRAAGVPVSETGPMSYGRSTLAQPIAGAATLGLEALAAPGASLEDTYKEAMALPGQVKKRQWTQMGLPEKRAYADASKVSALRFFTYHKPVDLRYLLDYAAMGVPEATTALNALGLSQFKAKDLGRAAIQQVTGIGIK